MKRLAIVVAIIFLSACSPSRASIAITNTSAANQIRPTTSMSAPIPTPGPFPSPLGNRAVFAYYFYWYDAITGDHMGSLTNVPTDYTTMSWQDVNWHKKQLEDMIYSGIDVILPVFWYDEESTAWSHPGLQKLAEALEQTRLEGKTPPAVGMFLDTTSSLGEDLRLQNEKDYVYKNIQFFFSTIPRGFWALAENQRPILWFYSSYFPAAFDQSFIDYIYTHFQKDFGVKPYLVFDKSWDYPTETINGKRIKNTHANHLNYDATYSWAGAFAPTASTQISSISPGYDDHTVPNRIPPSFIDRKNGDTYRDNFVYAIDCGTPWLAIETWNEYHEATEIAETVQYGRQYLDLTHKYIKYFKKGYLPEELKGIYANATSVSILFGEKNQENGLSLGTNSGDGQYTPVMFDNISALQTVPETENAQASHLYFLVDNSFYFDSHKKIEIMVTYYDNGTEPIDLQYDSAKCGSPFEAPKMYKEVFLARRQNTQTWKTASIQISDATFAGNQNFAADFRIGTDSSPLIVSQVKVQKIP